MDYIRTCEIFKKINAFYKIHNGLFLKDAIAIRNLQSLRKEIIYVYG